MTKCNNWKGCVKSGYGWRTWKGLTTTAHRIEFCKANGLELEDIAGLVVRHKCDNKLCINPDHLETGTQQDNVNDMISRGRGFRKLTESDIESIKQEYTRGSSSSGSAALAKKYGMCQANISQIVNGTALSGMSISDDICAFGEVKKISEWASDERCSVSAKTIMRRFCSGKQAEDAITSPSSRKRRTKQKLKDLINQREQAA